MRKGKRPSCLSVLPPTPLIPDVMNDGDEDDGGRKGGEEIENKCKASKQAGTKRHAMIKQDAMIGQDKKDFSQL